FWANELPSPRRTGTTITLSSSSRFLSSAPAVSTELPSRSMPLPDSFLMEASSSRSRTRRVLFQVTSSATSVLETTILDMAFILLATSGSVRTASAEGQYWAMPIYVARPKTRQSCASSCSVANSLNSSSTLCHSIDQGLGPSKYPSRLRSMKAVSLRILGRRLALDAIGVRDAGRGNLHGALGAQQPRRHRQGQEHDGRADHPGEMKPACEGGDSVGAVPHQVERAAAGDRGQHGQAEGAAHLPRRVEQSGGQSRVTGGDVCHREH